GPGAELRVPLRAGGAALPEAGLALGLEDAVRAGQDVERIDVLRDDVIATQPDGRGVGVRLELVGALALEAEAARDDGERDSGIDAGVRQAVGPDAVLALVVALERRRGQLGRDPDPRVGHAGARRQDDDVVALGD